MHNGGMLTRPAGLLAALLTTVLVAGCSGDDSSSDATPDETAGATTATSAAALEVPAGVELTSQGTSLAVGDAATLAWEPRQDTVGVIEVSVDRLERATFKNDFAGFKITDENRTTSPYFVRATITNVGETDLSGRQVPLYVVDGENRLIVHSTFGSVFRPCEQADFPKKFGPGATGEFCLVYLVPDRGDLTAVSFRPTQDVNPITWAGELKKPLPVAQEKPGKKGAKGTKNKGTKGAKGS